MSDSNPFDGQPSSKKTGAISSNQAIDKEKLQDTMSALKQNISQRPVQAEVKKLMDDNGNPQTPGYGR